MSRVVDDIPAPPPVLTDLCPHLPHASFVAIPNENGARPALYELLQPPHRLVLQIIIIHYTMPNE
jgi:hypothetical protein